MKGLVLVSLLLGFSQVSKAQIGCTRAGCPSVDLPHLEILETAIQSAKLKAILVKSLPHIGTISTRALVTDVYGAAIEQVSGTYALIKCDSSFGFGRASTTIVKCSVKQTSDLKIPSLIFLTEFQEYPVVTVNQFMKLLDGQKVDLTK